MIYIVGSLVIVAATILLWRQIKISYPFARGIAMAIGLSLLAVVCLAQNYNQSLIPGVNDGIGLGNPLVYWLLDDDRWSIEQFRQAFVKSINVTMLLIIAYPVVLVVETKLTRKTNTSL